MMFDAAHPVAMWSYGLAAAGYGLFSIYLLRRGYFGQGLRAGAMLAAAGLTCLWAASELAFGVGGRPAFFVLGAAIDVLRYGAWFVFLQALVSGEGRIAVRRGLHVIGVGLIGTGLGLHATRAFLPALGDLSRLLLMHAMATTIFALVLLEQLLRNVDPESRWNAKPLLIGLGGAFLFDLYLFSDALLFNRLDVDAFNVRGLIHLAVVPLLGLSIVRGGRQFAKIRLSQRAAFHSTTLVLVGAYLLFISLVGYYVRIFGGDWGRAMQYAILFLALLLLVGFLVSGSMRARVRVLIGKHFFRYRYDYREEWLRFTNALSAQGSLQGMGEQVIRGLANLVESPAGSLWLRDNVKGRFVQVARWNTPALPDEEEPDGPLCAFLRESGWVIDLAEFRSTASRYRDFRIPDWLSRSEGAWLVVPLVAGSDMIGFVVLARSRTEIEVDWEVNDLLKTAGRQAAAFLAQVMVAEELIEARKFDAFNRMSAFVVHDLKNIVTQLSLMVRNAERHGDNPEFRKDMLMTVENSVERMRQLMLQLREGSTPAGGQFGVHLAQIAQRICAARKMQGRTIELTVSEPVVARGHEDRIERVIGHAVQNAVEATEVSGRVWVIVDRDAGRARVVVGDDGHGMSPEFVKERLFRPFQTTKASGMGIGAYESFQYIRSLGGDVVVDSAEGVGTVITMLFPLFEPGPSGPALADGGAHG